jgi:hypothetical protein
MDSFYGFKIGDYVIANFAEFDTFEGQTFKITGFTSMSNRPVIEVKDIKRPDDNGTVFYPHELSWEDGSRPTV